MKQKIHFTPTLSFPWFLHLQTTVQEHLQTTVQEHFAIALRPLNNFRRFLQILLDIPITTRIDYFLLKRKATLCVIISDCPTVAYSRFQLYGSEAGKKTLKVTLIRILNLS